MPRTRKHVLAIVLTVLAALTFGGTVSPVGAVTANDAGVQSTDPILWYNTANGSGSIGTIETSDSHVTLRSYPAGAFANNWTHVVSTGNRILWYNSANGSGAIGTIDSGNNHVTLRTYPAGAFASNWTHVVAAGSRILWYNSANGSGAIGAIDATNSHVTLRTYWREHSPPTGPTSLPRGAGSSWYIGQRIGGNRRYRRHQQSCDTAHIFGG